MFETALRQRLHPEFSCSIDTNLACFALLCRYMLLDERLSALQDFWDSISTALFDIESRFHGEYTIGEPKATASSTKALTDRLEWLVSHIRKQYHKLEPLFSDRMVRSKLVMMRRSKKYRAKTIMFRAGLTAMLGLHVVYVFRAAPRLLGCLAVSSLTLY